MKKERYLRCVLILLHLIIFPLLLLQSRSEAQTSTVPIVKGDKVVHPKLTQTLSELKEKYKQGGRVFAQDFARDKNIRINEQDMAEVFILFNNKINKDLLESYGVQIKQSTSSILVADVPIVMFEDIVDNVPGIS